MRIHCDHCLCAPIIPCALPLLQFPRQPLDHVSTHSSTIELDQSFDDSLMCRLISNPRPMQPVHKPVDDDCATRALPHTDQNHGSHTACITGCVKTLDQRLNNFR